MLLHAELALREIGASRCLSPSLLGSPSLPAAWSRRVAHGGAESFSPSSGKHEEFFDGQPVRSRRVHTLPAAEEPPRGRHT